MKSLVSESKPFQSHFKAEIPDQAMQEAQLSHSKLKYKFLIDSEAELYMCLIPCIRFGILTRPKLTIIIFVSKFLVVKAQFR